MILKSKKSKIEMPKDLGIKIVSKEKAAWIKVRVARLSAIEDMEEALIIEREILKLAEQKLKQLKN